jgi:hypothetical protein
MTKRARGGYTGERLSRPTGPAWPSCGGLGQYTVATQCGRESKAVVPASLIDSLRGNAEEEIIGGGCRTPLLARYIVDKEKTLRAARRSFEDGDPEWKPY